MLLRTAQSNGGITVVVTNQIQSNSDGVFGEKSMSVGGQVMLYASTNVVQLRRLKLNNYVAELNISPCYARRMIEFLIHHRSVLDGDKQDPLRRRSYQK